MYTLFELTTSYGLIGLATAYTLIISLNNCIELSFLYYKEKLWSVTTDHLKIILLSLLTIAILLLIKTYTPVFIILPITLITVCIIKYFEFKYILNEVERNALITYSNKFKSQSYNIFSF